MATATLARSKNGIGPQLARLNAVRPSRHRVVSCYLKLEPRDRMRGKYLIKMKNRVRALEQALPALGLDREVEEAARRDLGRVLAWLGRPGGLPASQGLAIFACGPLKLFEAVPLPRVHRSRLAVDRTPLIRELAATEEEFGRLLAVVVDRTAARFFEVTAFGARELDGLSAGATRGGKFRGDQDGPGWGEHSYHNRIREEKQRHWDAVARHLFALDRREPAHGIVLAATGNEAGAITPFLHPYLLDRVMGSVRLNPKGATAAEVHAAALAVRQEWERTSERILLHEMEEGLGTGWAVNGMRPTLRALGRGQVRTLLIAADAGEPGYRADGTGRIAISEADLRGDTDVHPVIDVVDDAIEEALRQGVTLNVIFEPAAKQAVDGLAALLRFR
jgi:peptide chain release factor subunit 1